MSSAYPNSTTLPELTKRIAYNRDNRDYDCYIAFDGGNEQYIGSAGTYGAAEKACNDYAFSYYEDNHTPEKAVQVALATKSVQVENWQDDEEGHEYTDYKVGDGLTRVLLGTYRKNCEKPGFELIIGGDSINDKVDEVITLDDVRQLRDNLTALLNDPRVKAAA